MAEQLFEPVLAPFVGNLFELMGEGLVETWLERSAVVEFDAGQSRPLAQALALIELLRRHPVTLSAVQVLAVELDGGTQWLLTDSLAHARQLVGAIGGVEVGCHPVADVVHEQFGGIALLGTLG
jgi:hypothetical protein